jgi:hypothetical protein
VEGRRNGCDDGDRPIEEREKSRREQNYLGGGSLHPSEQKQN